jgi:hypothetical protein
VDVEGKTEIARARHEGSQAASGGQAKAKEGRPSKVQHEGAIPGTTQMGITRSLGQQAGANALGLSGMGDAA